jgi:CHAT domain
VTARQPEVSGVEEYELRELAEAARAVLGTEIVIEDPVEAARVEAKLSSALAMPEGLAKRALRAALFGHPALRQWLEERGVAAPDVWRLPEYPPTRGAGGHRWDRDEVDRRPDAPRWDDVDTEPDEEDRAEIREDEPARGAWIGEPGQPPEPAPVRRLAVDLPERAALGRRISLLVRITLAAPSGWRSAELRPFDVGPEGRTVTVTVSAPGLQAQTDLEQDLHVPPGADSDYARFGFVAGRAGLHTATVRAFAGGTFLGELAAQISVEIGATLEEGPTRTAEVGALSSEPGEVTLQVTMTDDRYSFQLLAEALYRVELSQRLAGDPAQVVGKLVDELKKMAAKQSDYGSPALIRTRLRNLGAQLWADAVPEAIRRQFWELAGSIRSFTVASDRDTIPWELLHPIDGDNENGFLVEQFPVVRRVYGQPRARRLPLASAAYVVPPNSPKNAREEVELVRARLPGIADQGVLDRLDQLHDLLEQAPSVLHFACHNEFKADTGSRIRLNGGPLDPSDLAPAVQRRGLAAASPLVFFNACRTAGEINGFLRLMGWAKQFMAAGAGAFIGSLWAVRSTSASVFADTFYQAFVTQQQPLGRASLLARQAIADDHGDPTWLAYTVYGNPAATIGAEGK